jgi:hypothetical protein
MRQMSEDLEDQTGIIFLACERRAHGGRASDAVSNSKSAKPHAFSGNDRATLSTRSGFKAISLARTRQGP